MHIAILGRQPALGMAELEKLYGGDNVRWFSDTSALVETNGGISIMRLGGTVKAGRVVAELPRGDWRQASMKLVRAYARAWADFDGKITLGVSAYGFDVSPREVQKTGIVLKQKLKESGVSLRLLPNAEPALSTAASHHNKLGLSANKVELLVVRARNGKVVIAESTGAQNITAYARRDQERPKRDAFVGMLPPKLAQMMINLTSASSQTRLAANPASKQATLRHASSEEFSLHPAELATAQTSSDGQEIPSSEAGQADSVSSSELAASRSALAVSSQPLDTKSPETSAARASSDAGARIEARSEAVSGDFGGEVAGEQRNPVLLDPFCGTGVILQEAALMDYRVYGTDLSEKMIRYARDNLNWLQESHRIKFGWYLHEGDAMTATWRPPIDAVACETYLGQPFSAPPSPAKLAEVRKNCDHIISTFLKNIAPQLKTGTPLCVGVPAWRSADGSFTHLSFIGNLERLGFDRHEFKNIKENDLLYYREDQVVARELLVLTKK